MIVEASRTINLGKQGDNDYTVVKFDVSGWSAYGDGIFSLNHKRSIDCSAYPCVVSYENGFVYWTIKATDTQFAGNGLAQLVYSNEDGVIIHTEIYNTFVAKSLVTTDTPPEPFRPWVDRITGMIETETAQRMADDEDLANAIDEEAVTRAANDTTLNNKIEAEAQQRAEEDAELWDAIETAGSVRDVQINGTSILDGGVANITGARVRTALGYEPADADGVDRLSESITEISNKKVDKEIVSDVTGIVKEAKAIDARNGNESSAFAHTVATDFVDVPTDGGKLYYTGHVFYYLGIAGYDADNRFVATVLMTDAGVEGVFEDYELDIPSNVKKIRASSYSGTQTMGVVKIEKKISLVQSIVDNSERMSDIESSVKENTFGLNSVKAEVFYDDFQRWILS